MAWFSWRGASVFIYLIARAHIVFHGYIQRARQHCNTASTFTYS